ncbi:MAG: zeta toxin family protein, partial [Bryobacteraceae bacterium]
MPTRIPRLQGLSPREAAIEAQVLARVEANPDDYLAAYEKRFGNELNADNAAELFPEYAYSTHTRTWNREAVHAAARWIIFELFRRKVESAAEDGLRWVIFTSGGTGSGKSTRAAEWHGQPGALIYDSTFAHQEGAVKQIEMALAAGLGVLVYYTYRDPGEAFAGVLERAMGTGRGRTVRLMTHAESHRLSALTIRQLAARYT